MTPLQKKILELVARYNREKADKDFSQKAMIRLKSEGLRKVLEAYSEEVLTWLVNGDISFTELCGLAGEYQQGQVCSFVLFALNKRLKSFTGEGELEDGAMLLQLAEGCFSYISSRRDKFNLPQISGESCSRLEALQDHLSNLESQWPAQKERISTLKNKIILHNQKAQLLSTVGKNIAQKILGSIGASEFSIRAALRDKPSTEIEHYYRVLRILSAGAVFFEDQGAKDYWTMTLSQFNSVVGSLPPVPTLSDSKHLINARLIKQAIAIGRLCFLAGEAKNVTEFNLLVGQIKQAIQEIESISQGVYTEIMSDDATEQEIYFARISEFEAALSSIADKEKQLYTPNVVEVETVNDPVTERLNGIVNEEREAGGMNVPLLTEDPEVPEPKVFAGLDVVAARSEVMAEVVVVDPETAESLWGLLCTLHSASSVAWYMSGGVPQYQVENGQMVRAGATPIVSKNSMLITPAQTERIKIGLQADLLSLEQVITFQTVMLPALSCGDAVQEAAATALKHAQARPGELQQVLEKEASVPVLSSWVRDNVTPVQRRMKAALKRPFVNQDDWVAELAKPEIIVLVDLDPEASELRRQAEETRAKGLTEYVTDLGSKYGDDVEAFAEEVVATVSVTVPAYKEEVVTCLMQRPLQERQRIAAVICAKNPDADKDQEFQSLAKYGMLPATARPSDLVILQENLLRELHNYLREVCIAFDSFYKPANYGTSVMTFTVSEVAPFTVTLSCLTPPVEEANFDQLKTRVVNFEGSVNDLAVVTGEAAGLFMNQLAAVCDQAVSLVNGLTRKDDGNALPVQQYRKSFFLGSLQKEIASCNAAAKKRMQRIVSEVKSHVVMDTNVAAGAGVAEPSCFDVFCKVREFDEVSEDELVSLMRWESAEFTLQRKMAVLRSLQAYLREAELNLNAVCLGNNTFAHYLGAFLYSVFHEQLTSSNNKETIDECKALALDFIEQTAPSNFQVTDLLLRWFSRDRISLDLNDFNICLAVLNNESRSVGQNSCAAVVDFFSCNLHRLTVDQLLQMVEADSNMQVSETVVEYLGRNLNRLHVTSMQARRVVAALAERAEINGSKKAKQLLQVVMKNEGMFSAGFSKFRSKMREGNFLEFACQSDALFKVFFANDYPHTRSRLGRETGTLGTLKKQLRELLNKKRRTAKDCLLLIKFASRKISRTSRVFNPYFGDLVDHRLTKSFPVVSSVIEFASDALLTEQGRLIMPIDMQKTQQVLSLLNVAEADLPLSGSGPAKFAGIYKNLLKAMVYFNLDVESFPKASQVPGSKALTIVLHFHHLMQFGCEGFNRQAQDYIYQLFADLSRVEELTKALVTLSQMGAKGLDTFNKLLEVRAVLEFVARTEDPVLLSALNPKRNPGAGQFSARVLNDAVLGDKVDQAHQTYLQKFGHGLVPLSEEQNVLPRRKYQLQIVKSQVVDCADPNTAATSIQYLYEATESVDAAGATSDLNVVLDFNRLGQDEAGSTIWLWEGGGQVVAPGASFETRAEVEAAIQASMPAYIKSKGADFMNKAARLITQFCTGNNGFIGGGVARAVTEQPSDAVSPYGYHAIQKAPGTVCLRLSGDELVVQVSYAKVPLMNCDRPDPSQQPRPKVDASMVVSLQKPTATRAQGKASFERYVYASDSLHGVMVMLRAAGLLSQEGVAQQLALCTSEVDRQTLLTVKKALEFFESLNATGGIPPLVYFMNHGVCLFAKGLRQVNKKLTAEQFKFFKDYLVDDTLPVTSGAFLWLRDNLVPAHVVGAGHGEGVGGVVADELDAQLVGSTASMRATLMAGSARDDFGFVPGQVVPSVGAGAGYGAAAETDTDEETFATASSVSIASYSSAGFDASGSVTKLNEVKDWFGAGDGQLPWLNVGAINDFQKLVDVLNNVADARRAQFLDKFYEQGIAKYPPLLAVQPVPVTLAAGETQATRLKKDLDGFGSMGPDAAWQHRAASFLADLNVETEYGQLGCGSYEELLASQFVEDAVTNAGLTKVGDLSSSNGPSTAVTFRV